MTTKDELIEVVKLGNYVVLDTETTGLQQGEICQIAIIGAERSVLLNTLVKPNRPIPPDATRVHGITNQMVTDAPHWATVQEQVREIIAGKNVIIYNAVYDRKMMHQSDEAAGLSRVDYKAYSSFFCAMLAYAEHRGEWNDYRGSWRWHKLSDACQHERLPVESAHDALGDCLMTLALLNAFCK